MTRRSSDPPVAPLPPPSATLRALVQQTQPVALRSRWKAFSIAVIGGVIIALLACLLRGVRGDISQGAPAWFWVGAATRGGAFVLATAAALIPRTGSVFPDGDLVRNASILVPFVAPLSDLAVSPALLFDATLALRREQHLTAALACGGTGTLVLVSGLLVAWVSLRNAAVPPESRWFGAAIGAGMGSLGALVLHVVCDHGNVAHLVTVHSGVVLLGALVGAVLARRVSAYAR